MALARAVAHRPALLLADEPTAHLDRARGEQAIELLTDNRRRAGHATLIVVTHDPAVMSAFDAPHRDVGERGCLEARTRTRCSA